MSRVIAAPDRVGGGRYTSIPPLLTDRAGIPPGAVPLVLLGFGLGALAGTTIGGRLGDRRPLATTITAAAAAPAGPPRCSPVIALLVRDAHRPRWRRYRNVAPEPTHLTERLVCPSGHAP